MIDLLTAVEIAVQKLFQRSILFQTLVAAYLFSSARAASVAADSVSLSTLERATLVSSADHIAEPCDVCSASTDCPIPYSWRISSTNVSRPLLTDVAISHVDCWTAVSFTSAAVTSSDLPWNMDPVTEVTICCTPFAP